MKQLDFIGCNVTVPHKFEVMDCCDDLSEDARAMGAVNTVIFGDQTLGHNTDAPGLVRAIREDFGIDLADLKVMIVGVGGGAGRAVATQCARIGCDQIWLVNRTLEKAQNLLAELESHGGQTNHLAGPGERFTAMAPEDPDIAEAAGTQFVSRRRSKSMQQSMQVPVRIPVDFKPAKVVKYAKEAF